MFNVKMLMSMLSRSKKYKRSKEELMNLYINERLSKSLESYYSELADSIDYLNRKDSMRIVKTMRKEVVDEKN